jgi:hypothetical protein
VFSSSSKVELVVDRADAVEEDDWTTLAGCRLLLLELAVEVAELERATGRINTSERSLLDTTGCRELRLVGSIIFSWSLAALAALFFSFILDSLCVCYGFCLSFTHPLPLSCFYIAEALGWS